MLKIYNYMRNSNSCVYRREEFPTASQKGWDISYAGKMLTVRTDQGKYAGNCYSFAATYAYLVKRVTGLPVRIGMGSTNVFKRKNLMKLNHMPGARYRSARPGIHLIQILLWPQK